ncbi:glycosyltransferase family 2 protein [Pelagibacteraceae bacterium]|nr:glycosyltransferase family 2 protein [Pelagibacteraceae bacterium]
MAKKLNFKSKNNPIKISFIVPIYNKEKYLNNCINSIYSLIKYFKFNKNIEVIAIDDCSTDNSLQVLKKWKKKIGNLRIFPLNKNYGVSFARNLGIKKSKGEYIFFVDADDFIFPKSCIKIFKTIKQNQLKDVFIFYNKVNNKKYNTINESSLVEKSYNSFDVSASKLNNILTWWNIGRIIIKKKFIIKNRVFFKKLFQFEDWVFFAELISKKPSFLIINQFAYNYRMTKLESLGKELNFRSLTNLIKTYQFLINIINRHESKTIKIMSYDILKFINIDLFLFENHKIFKLKEKFPFLKKMINKNLIFRKKIFKITKLNNIILFCAGRLGRSLSFMLTDIKQTDRIIIDNNQFYHNKRINNFLIKSFDFFCNNSKKFQNYKIIICIENRRDINLISKQILRNKFKKNQILSIND